MNGTIPDLRLLHRSVCGSEARSLLRISTPLPISRCWQLQRLPLSLVIQNWLEVEKFVLAALNPKLPRRFHNSILARPLSGWCQVVMLICVRLALALHPDAPFCSPLLRRKWSDSVTTILNYIIRIILVKENGSLTSRVVCVFFRLINPLKQNCS